MVDVNEVVEAGVESMEGTQARKILAFVVIRVHFPLSSISLSFFLSLSPLYVRVCVGVCLCVCVCVCVRSCVRIVSPMSQRVPSPDRGP